LTPFNEIKVVLLGINKF